MKGIADTGFIVAFLNRTDQHHAWARDLAEGIVEPLLTCEYNGLAVVRLLELIRIIDPAIKLLARLGSYIVNASQGCRHATHSDSRKANYAQSRVHDPVRFRNQCRTRIAVGQVPDLRPVRGRFMSTTLCAAPTYPQAG